MFNEREALRLRLEQLNEAEVKVIREYQIERDKIYAKLRELDRNGSPSEIKKDFRSEKKPDSLPVLAELAAQEIRSYQPQSQQQSSVQPQLQSISSSCRYTRRNNTKKKRDGKTGIKSS